MYTEFSQCLRDRSISNDTGNICRTFWCRFHPNTRTKTRNFSANCSLLHISVFFERVKADWSLEWSLAVCGRSLSVCSYLQFVTAALQLSQPQVATVQVNYSKLLQKAWSSTPAPSLTYRKWRSSDVTDDVTDARSSSSSSSAQSLKPLSSRPASAHGHACTEHHAYFCSYC